MSYALSRTVSRSKQIAQAFALGVLFAAAVVPMVLFAEKNVLVYAAIVVLGGFSLLLFWAAIHQLFTLRTPQTVVEIDVETLRRGGEVQLTFRQPGTGSYESLRANLAGEERWVESGYGNRRVRRVKQLGTFHVFDSGPFEAPWETTVRVHVPDLPHAEATHGEYWRLEVWGKIRGRADFLHAYDLRVQRSESR